MQDHYKTLGINSSATHEEIRRAYRILARRYHPDVNPGKASEDKFKAISAAYQILSDTKKRSDYDAEYERIQIASFAEKFRSRLKSAGTQKQKVESYTREFTREVKKAGSRSLGEYGKWYEGAKEVLVKTVKKFGTLGKSEPEKPQKIASVSIIEISVTIKEALFGLKKTIEIPHAGGTRKVSVTIPAGVRSGSVLRLRQRTQRASAEEIVIIIRVAQHPFISLQNKGLVVEVPVSLSEALFGANITLPSLDESIVVKIPPGSQSGTEIRVKGKGVLSKERERGDIIYRLLVKVPQSPRAVGIEDKARELDKYYDEPVRRNFPSNFFDL